MTDQEHRDAAKLFAKMGGQALLKKRGKNYFKELSRKGVEKKKQLREEKLQSEANLPS